MTAEWMVYCALWSVLVSAGAWLIECVLRRGQAPLRAIWVAALALSIVGPIVGYLLPRSTVSAPATISKASAPVTVVMTRPAIRQVSASQVAPTTTSALAGGWIILSSAMLLYVVGGLAHLRQLRRRWRAANVAGTNVMVSEDTGPAVVGVLRGTIVIPEWTLNLDEKRLALVLRHELEHQRAGDTTLLSLAQLVLVAMPWNPLAWWQVSRLRLAIELDCDARVLRAEPDVRTYGTLLLEVGRPNRRFALAGAAMSDRAGDLEQRIRMMTRRAKGLSRAGAALSLGAAVVAIVAGCSLPAPERPAPASTNARPTATTSASPTPIAPAPTATTGSAAITAKAQKPNSTAATSDSAKSADAAALYADVSSRLRQLQELADRAKRARPDTALEREVDALRRQLTEAALARDASTNLSPAMRAVQPFPIQSDSEAAASQYTACSSGLGSDDSYVVKLLVADSLARRDGRIEIAAGAGDRTMITLSDPQMGWPLMSCSMTRAGTLRLYGPEAFQAPIIVQTAVPASVIVMTGSGKLLAGPVVVTNETRKYQMAWSALPR